MREFLWKRIFNNTYWYNTEYAVLHCVAVCVLVFVVCSTMALIFKFFIKQKWERLLNVLILNQINAIFSYIQKKM